LRFILEPYLNAKLCYTNKPFISTQLFNTIKTKHIDVSVFVCVCVRSCARARVQYYYCCFICLAVWLLLTSPSLLLLLLLLSLLLFRCWICKIKQNNCNLYRRNLYQEVRTLMIDLGYFRGNQRNVAPYVAGKQCSACSEDKCQIDGLCSNYYYIQVFVTQLLFVFLYGWIYHLIRNYIYVMHALILTFTVNFT